MSASIQQAGERLVVIDTETTGIAAADRVVAFAGIELVDGRATGRAMSLVFNPGRPCHWAARRAHGLSDDYLALQPGFAAHAAEIRGFLRGAVLVGHNVGFDIRMLNGEFRLAALEGLDGQPAICTVALCRRHYPGEKAGLDLALQRIGLGRSTAVHGAFEDAALTAALYQHLRHGAAEAVVPLLPPTNEVAMPARRRRPAPVSA
ncbi:MAG TPA: exonuclease domain-containing protein [Alphaproteobacteria bacterium]|nr:exonuclease domain-containing protein [Alphaproteobacteria bacterium]